VARFLFVIVPVVARVWPAVAIGDALATLGHEVAWCGPEADLRPRVGPDVTIYPTGKRSYREFHGVGLEAVRELWDEYVLPLNRFIRGPVERAMADFQPDVVFVDQYALAGALAAYQQGVPWATLCAGVLELTPPSGISGLEELVQSRLAKYRPDGVDLLFSPHLVLATTSRTLMGEAILPPNCVLIGAALGARRTDPQFDWQWWDPGRRHVLVTAGTLSDHLVADYLARLLAALEPMGAKVQVIFNVASDAVPAAPPHILVAPKVPMLELMPRLDAVICQAGQSTVNEALVNGVPLVMAPIRLGELAVAEQVTRAGAGVTVSFETAAPAALAEAVTAVLEEPSYQDSARTISDEFVAAGGTKTAAAQLIALADQRQ